MGNETELLANSQAPKANRITYDWTLAGATFAKNRGRVFSCFSGGGGSTMGYKLAG